MTPSGAEIVREMLRLSAKLDDGLNLLDAQSKLYAQAENRYRLAKSRAVFRSDAELLARGYSPKARTVQLREAYVDEVTGEEREEAHEAEVMMLAARETVRARRAQLSALQSIAGVVKAEAEFARTGPDLDPGPEDFESMRDNYDRATGS